MDNSSICILILNWNGAEDTLECISSLQKISYSNTKLVVIDNGSQDDSVARIRAEYPEITIIELETNLLYAGGNNAGLKWASENDYDYVVFLNNDTVVEPDFLEPLLAAFVDHPQVGMVAPLMCYMAEKERVWYGGGIVNLWTGEVAHRHIRESISQVTPGIATTDYITGCCLMMPTALASQLNGFDPSFPMYGEDVDLSLRCRNEGYELYLVPESKIYHKVSSSMGGEFNSNKILKKAAGLLKLYSRHLKWYQWPSMMISQIFLIVSKAIGLVLYQFRYGTESQKES